MLRQLLEPESGSDDALTAPAVFAFRSTAIEAAALL